MGPAVGNAKYDGMSLCQYITDGRNKWEGPKISQDRRKSGCLVWLADC